MNGGKTSDGSSSLNLRPFITQLSISFISNRVLVPNLMCGILINAASIPGFEVSREPKEVYTSLSGDMAYVLAQNYFKSIDSLNNTVTTFNKSPEIWKKQANGDWKCVVDMYNSDPTIKSIR